MIQAIRIDLDGTRKTLRLPQGEPGQHLVLRDAMGAQVRRIAVDPTLLMWVDNQAPEKKLPVNRHVDPILARYGADHLAPVHGPVIFTGAALTATVPSPGVQSLSGHDISTILGLGDKP